VIWVQLTTVAGPSIDAVCPRFGLQAVDGLGFAIGGYIARSFVVRSPGLVRRLVLVGTAPRHGELANDLRIAGIAANPVPTLDDFLFLFFTPSAAGQAAGKAFWQRRHQRTDAPR